MVNRIEIIPLEVRGYGNIIIPKTATDFIGKYNEIYTNSQGDFILSYGGVMLKMAATVQNTIHGLTARLNIIVTTREGNSPVSDLSVECTIDSTVLTPKTTDTDGACYFTWTPAALGDSTILLTIPQQEGYAALTETKEITIGLLLSFNTIMNDLRLEDDEVYIADITQQVQSRTQLTEFVKDVWVAEGGEPIVDPYGIIHLASKGDVIVEQDELNQLPEYDNILFEGDVETLIGAVYDMSITEDYELVINCLEREDIIGASGISLTASQTSVTYGSSVTLTATVIDGDTPVSGETVTFYDGETSLGTDTTDSDGVATLSTSSLSIGSHSCTAVYDEYTSNVVTVTVSDVPAPTPASVSLTSDKSILSYADSESATLSATVLDSSSNPIEGVTVEFFNGSTSLGTATTNSSGVATKTYASAGSGDISLTAEVGSLVSETYEVEDCIFYGINTSAFIIPSNTTFTSDGDKITATTSTSGEKVVYLNHTLSNSDNWVFETELAQLGTVQHMAIIWNDNTFYGGTVKNYSTAYYAMMDGDTTKQISNVAGDVYRVVRENGVTTVTVNDNQIVSKTISHKSSFKVGYFINQGRTQYYKNIKLKPL